MREVLRTCYELCARISEVVGESSPGDTSEARGPRGNEAERVYYEKDDVRAKAWVAHVKTAKRGGMERWVGLPVELDPWASDLADYFLSQEDRLVFPFTRQAVTEFVHSNDVFEGMEWPVQEYRIFLAPALRDPSGRILEDASVRKIEGHMKPFTVHSLRDARATELLNDYNFDGVDLAIHGGWAVQRAVTGVTPVMARYLDLYRDWKRPFPKLLKGAPISSANSTSVSATSSSAPP
jgi:hypothetical protein